MDCPNNLNPKDWEKTYQALPAPKQTQFLLQSLCQPLPEDIGENIDFVSLMETHYQYLLQQGDIKTLLLLHDLLKKNNWHLIDEYSFLLDALVAEVLLYKHSFAPALNIFDELARNPGKTADHLIPLIERLVLYQQDSLIKDRLKGYLEVIRNASGLIPGAHIELATIMATQAVEAFQPGDSEKLFSETESYEIFPPQSVPWIIETLQTNQVSLRGPIKNQDYDQNQDWYYTVLSVDFMKFLKTEKGIPFPCSFMFWQGFTDTVLVKDNNGNLTFQFSVHKTDAYLTDRFGFLSPVVHNAFAVLWGLPYVYDYLLARNLINIAEHSRAQNHIQYLKLDIMYYSAVDLWKYDFVNSWDKASSIKDDDWQREKELFRQSFTDKVDIVCYFPQDFLIWLKHNPRDSDDKSMLQQLERQIPKLGRKAHPATICPCQSGATYLKCCGKKTG